jgi:hypothetical protein
VWQWWNFNGLGLLDQPMPNPTWHAVRANSRAIVSDILNIAQCPKLKPPCALHAVRANNAAIVT